MARPRDNRRQKLYNAEREAFEDKFDCDKLEGWSVQECQAYVDKIKRSRWWSARYKGRPEIRVIDGRGHRRAVAYPATWDHPRAIALPLWARKKWVILHELAHHTATIKHGYAKASHGPEFAKEYLALIQRWLGKEEADALRAAYKVHRVKYRVKSC